MNLDTLTPTLDIGYRRSRKPNFTCQFKLRDARCIAEFANPAPKAFVKICHVH